MENKLHKSRYVVMNENGDWRVRSASQHIAAKFPSKQQALCAAIECAERDGARGHVPEVLVRHEDNHFIIEWTYGEGPHPDDAARPAGKKQPNRSGA
jgi:hypothetical protein